MRTLRAGSTHGSRLSWLALTCAALLACSAAQEAPGASAVPAAQPVRGITIYTTSWCPYCAKAVAQLDRAGVSYLNLDIEKDPDARRRMIDLVGNTAVPVIDVDGHIMQGYDRQRLEQLLRDREPPETAVES